MMLIKYTIIVMLSLTTCVAPSVKEERLAPWKPTVEFRLDNIKQAASEDPVKAIHLISMFEACYPGAEAENIAVLKNLAVRNIEALKEKAVLERRFDDAVSMARSLANLSVEDVDMEMEFLLADAKEQLAQGNNLGAFLSAVHANSLKPLSFMDALPFLERAVAVKQRRTAAFFLSIIDGQGAIDPEIVEYANRQDLPRDMVKGVATVMVDQGVKIEKGRAFPAVMLGSAFFVDADGYLITNYHVISSEVDPEYEGYSKSYIRMGDASSPRLPVKVVGYDRALDLALLKAEVAPEYVFSVADWIVPSVGDSIIAIGSPAGLEKTVTQGIVSALGRRFLQIGDVIQIDAAINHGNSGGPVVDRQGRLVGIAFAAAGTYQGLNFAIPSERLAAALPAMLKGGKAERAWLGVTLSETSAGAEIIYVAPFTPAADAQIPEGSIIASVNREKITASPGGLIPALQDILFSTKPGELASLETTDGEIYTLMSASRPNIPLLDAVKKDSKERLTAPLFGLILSPSLERAPSSAYRVKKVVRGSIADDAGLSTNDPVTIRGLRIAEKEGYALLDIDVKKRRMGYLETSMRLPAYLDSSDTL
ncbi:MAG: trypsin-like peptidase domain-containing protein [Treponema sp.]|jgi:S1-C subfamily serine protease|nr:trypsin-like peptidase domain-containing protein [Treponema sp.]